MQLNQYVTRSHIRVELQFAQRLQKPNNAAGYSIKTIVLDQWSCYSGIIESSQV